MFTITSLLALFGLSSAFAAVALVFAAWMAWRIVAKAGLPGWLGLIAVLLTLTGIGVIVPLVALWVFAFMGWPRDGTEMRADDLVQYESRDPKRSRRY